MVMCIGSPVLLDTWEPEAGLLESGVQGQPGQYSKTHLNDKNKNQNKNVINCLIQYFLNLKCYPGTSSTNN